MTTVLKLAKQVKRLTSAFFSGADQSPRAAATALLEIESLATRVLIDDNTLKPGVDPAEVQALWERAATDAPAEQRHIWFAQQLESKIRAQL